MQINSMPQQTPIMQVQMIVAVSAGGWKQQWSGQSGSIISIQGIVKWLGGSIRMLIVAR